jgi:hypothetical protein
VIKLIEYKRLAFLGKLALKLKMADPILLLVSMIQRNGFAGSQRRLWGGSALKLTMPSPI